MLYSDLKNLFLFLHLKKVFSSLDYLKTEKQKQKKQPCLPIRLFMVGPAWHQKDFLLEFCLRRWYTIMQMYSFPGRTPSYLLVFFPLGAFMILTI